MVNRDLDDVNSDVNDANGTRETSVARRRSIRSQPGADVKSVSAQCETPGEKILEMIVRQCELFEIFEALCFQIGEVEEESQVAFFTLEGDSWFLAAKGPLDEESAAALKRLIPEHVSGLLLGENRASGNGAEFEDGWGRHLYSGIGELLGMLVCFGPAPFTPVARRASRIDGLCRLTTLAIEQWNLRQELTWQSDHDSVTGLHTQAFFDRRLASRMRPGHGPVALIHVNLDRFRLVNDVLGRALGNRILRYIGMRFGSVVDAADLLARPGGDEFAVLLDPGTPARAARLAERMLQSLALPLSVDTHQVFISASIGIAWEGPDSTPQSLQREAYVALYHAKKAGKARALPFDPSMAATPPERLEMEKCLRSALAREEMLLYYQPQIDLGTGRVAGAEALLRWNPAGVGIISPGTIIPILEETGLIVQFGRWVLREACLQGKRWMDSTGIPIRIGVNVSALQVRSPGFVEDVVSALNDSGYAAHFIELELTESLFIGDYQLARETLGRLRDLGVTLALDDFGTGRSSLSYLQELPFHRLKIDQSFVRAVSAGARCPPIIENIVNMARSLGMTSIAEGIDDPGQVEVLRSVACDEGQGFLYSPPLPPDEFLRYRVALEGACTHVVSDK